MSTRKGNNKKRGQKYQNRTGFKSDLHDTSKTTKLVNELVVGGVCERCCGIIEWRKKYKKYKSLAAPKKWNDRPFRTKCMENMIKVFDWLSQNFGHSTLDISESDLTKRKINHVIHLPHAESVKCEQKTVKHAYHTICMNCAVTSGVCEKCGVKSDEITRSKPSAADQAAEDSKLQAELKHLSERQRRAFFRGLERGTLTSSGSGKTGSDSETSSENDNEELDADNEHPVT